MAIGSIELSIEQFLLPLQQNSLQKSDPQKQPAYSHTQQLLQHLQLDKLKLKLNIDSSPIKLSIDLDHLNLPKPYTNLNELMFSCQSLDIEASYIACTMGTVSIRGLFDELITSADFSFTYNLEIDEFILSLNNMDIGHGLFASTFKIDKHKWQVELNGKNINYQMLKQYLDFYFEETMSSLDEFGAIVSFSGQLTGSLADKNSASASQPVPENSFAINTIDLKGHITNLHYASNEDIAENLYADYVFNLKNITKQTHQISIAVNNISGELLQNDIYVAFTGKEHFTARANYQGSKRIINLKRFSIKRENIFEVVSSGLIDLAKKQAGYTLNTTFNIQDLAGFNDLYLKNILDGSDYQGLEIEGRLKAKVSQDKQLFDISSEFHDLSLSFNEQLAIIDLNGHINWNNNKQSLKPVPESQLSWQEISLNHLPLGPTQLKFKTQNDQLRLLHETDIPVFDGFLHINTLELSQIGQTVDVNTQQTGINIAIDGMIKPISLDKVSRHFDWPILDGKLSAVIPYTTYNEHLLAVGGALMMQVFGGVVIVKDLKIEQPLSDYARLFANIDLKNINLQSLTKTYNFGEIEGRVEGKFSQLELNSWQPVAFDAYIRTPENDKSSHKISQRAIDNLSSLGGASGILSRSFLSFFETFRYDKLGLSCKLKNNICKMSGIETSGDGKSYYIVKGGGIPRIDVMGFQDQVNWHVLTSRLKTIQSANEAVIE